MYTHLPELTSSSNSPFDCDKLGRASHITHLTNVVSTLDMGCVMAINGEWGAGKTTFVKMWQNWLNQHGFSTSYYNAWETDYMEDPIIPIAGELYELLHLDNFDDKANAFMLKFDSTFFRAASKFFRHKVKEYVGEEVCKDLENGTQILTSPMMKVLGDYRLSKQSISDLKGFIKDVAEEAEKPYIFFIDELDRCKPSYAVSVLERIKHLFNVPNIVFVLSIDKEQLAHSVRGYYGSDKIAAEEYLKRFIDFEYKLPYADDLSDFIGHLFRVFGLHSFLSFMDNESKSAVVLLTTALFKAVELNPRQAEQLFSHFQFTIRALGHNSKYDLSTALILMYLRLYKPTVFRCIANREYSLQELVDTLEATLPKVFFTGMGKYDRNRAAATYSIATLLDSYFQEELLYNPHYFWTSIEGEKHEKLTFRCSVMQPKIISDALYNPTIDPRDLRSIKSLTDAVEFGASLT